MSDRATHSVRGSGTRAPGASAARTVSGDWIGGIALLIFSVVIHAYALTRFSNDACGTVQKLVAPSSTRGHICDLDSYSTADSFLPLVLFGASAILLPVAAFLLARRHRGIAYVVMILIVLSPIAIYWGLARTPVKCSPEQAAAQNAQCVATYVPSS